MKFEIGKLYKLKTNIDPVYNSPIRFFNWTMDEMDVLPSGTILLYVDDERFYKDHPRRFLFDNVLYSESHNWSYKQEANLIFEEITEEP